MSIKEVHPQKLTKGLSAELKNRDEITPPDWSHFVKTGAHKEKPPENPDWWYLRSASVLRQVHKRGPIGVSRLRKIYGGKIERGSAPEKFRKGSGKIVRTILQQLEEADLIEKRKGKGRKVSPKGLSLISRISKKIKNKEEN